MLLLLKKIQFVSRGLGENVQGDLFRREIDDNKKNFQSIQRYSSPKNEFTGYGFHRGQPQAWDLIHDFSQQPRSLIKNILSEFGS